MAETYDTETGEIEQRQTLPAPVERERNLIFASQECDQIFGALAEAQGTMSNPSKNKKAKVKGKSRSGAEYEYEYSYAPLDEIVNVIREPLRNSGLVHRQFLAQRGGNWVMRTIIAHKSGQWYGADYPIFFDESRGMQGFASGVTYARRYGLMMALGIVGEDDDDANVADGKPAEIASRGQGGQGSAGAPSGAGQRAPASQRAAGAAVAPTETPEQADAKKRHTEIVALIDESRTVPEVDGVFTSQAFVAFDKKGREAYPNAHDGVLARLHERADKRKADLMGGGEGDYR